MASNEILMKALREYWRKRDFKSFQNMYQLSKWMLSKEDVENIENALQKLRGVRNEKDSELLTSALDIIPGSRFVE